MLDSIENFLERNYCHYRRYDILALYSTKHRLGYRERHLLARANQLRSTDNRTASTHACQYFTYSLIDLIQLDYVRLKGAMDVPIYRHQRECNEVRIFLKCLL